MSWLSSTHKQRTKLKPIEYVNAVKPSNMISSANSLLKSRNAMESQKAALGSPGSGHKLSSESDNDTRHVALKKKKNSLTSRKTVGLYDPSRIRKYMRWSSMSRVGPGLFNQGNTCFLNSTLQCLLHIPALVQLLNDSEESKLILQKLTSSSIKNADSSQNDGIPRFKNTNVKSGQKSILQHFQGLVSDAWGKRTSKAISPKGMVTTIRRVGRQFRPMRQEDAHEYLRQLIDCMHEEILKAENVKLSDGLIAESTFISRLFGGQFCSELRCGKCKYRSPTFNYFQDLSLEVSQGISSIDGALAAFQASEKLSSGNEWRCEGCKKLVQATKKIFIYKAPNVLVLHLKRFSYGRGKINKMVSYSMKLSLRVNGLHSDMTMDANKTSPPKRDGTNSNVEYELIGMVVHHGHSSHSGHYVAFVRGPNKQWYEMNDSQVSVASEKKVLSQQAYILFYNRVVPNAEMSKEINEKENQEKVETTNKSFEDKLQKYMMSDEDLGDLALKMKSDSGLPSRKNISTKDTLQTLPVPPASEMKPANPLLSLPRSTPNDSKEYVESIMSPQEEARRAAAEEAQRLVHLSGLEDEDSIMSTGSSDSDGDDDLRITSTKVDEMPRNSRLPVRHAYSMRPMCFPMCTKGFSRVYAYMKHPLPLHTTPMKLDMSGFRDISSDASDDDMEEEKEEEEESDDDNDDDGDEKVEEEEEEEHDLGKIFAAGTVARDDSDSSDGVVVNGGSSDSESSDSEDSEDLAAMKDKSRSLFQNSPFGQSRGEDEISSELDDNTKEKDMRNILLKQGRRSKSLSGDAHWEDIGEDVISKRNALEKSIIKSDREAKNSGKKRDVAWDRALDSGRVKKVKIKEDELGVHESFHTGKNDFSKSSKKKNESTPNVAKNPFQIMAEKVANNNGVVPTRERVNKNVQMIRDKTKQSIKDAKRGAGKSFGSVGGKKGKSDFKKKGKSFGGKK